MSRLYMGWNRDDVLAAANDVLAEACLAEGEVTLDGLRGVLPALEEGIYGFLSGVQTQGSTLFDHMGRLYNQEQHGVFSPAELLSNASPFFNPAKLDCRLGALQPSFQWVENAPILRWTHMDGKETLRFEAFVSPLDPGTCPYTWLRAERLSEDLTLWVWHRIYCISGLQDAWPETSMDISSARYEAERAETITWWIKHRPPVRFELGEPSLSKLFDRIHIQAQCSFSGLHPKYGHAYYGISLGDNFPPNMICMIEAVFLAGDAERACGLVRYTLQNCVRTDGTLAYYGPSATEYGQLLWLFERIEPAVRTYGGLYGLVHPISQMAGYLLSLIDSNGLIAIGAEADTRHRVAVYANNNLWAARGLCAAGALLNRLDEKGDTFIQAGEKLTRTILHELEKSALQTQFGHLPPFRLDYPALPWTLSSCAQSSQSVSPNELMMYLAKKRLDGDVTEEQELGENTYANYRYYPEILSAALLPPDMEHAITALRRGAGGELLGMTRFMGWLDDWPAFNYARYLLENDEGERYRMLLYAHMLYHGCEKMGAYYEQVAIDGSVIAEDCVPSLLLPAMMISWMFVFEPVRETALYLGRGVPACWYHMGATGVSNALCSRGVVHWRAYKQDGALHLTYDLPATDTPVFWHCPIQGVNSDSPVEEAAPGLIRLSADALNRTRGNLRFILS